MQSLSSSERESNLSILESKRFDVLIIGGGVTGAGVALDAIARGYSVALVEKADFASSTSSKSTKLVHGGIRYLPNFDFALVHEALIERGILLQNAPFLVHPLGFVLPIYEGDKHPVGVPFGTPGGKGMNFIVSIGLWLYDIMAGKRGVRLHRHLRREQVLSQAPTLVAKGLKMGFVYYDAQTHDARLTMTILKTAAQYGAVIANYSEVTGFTHEAGKLNGATVRDVVSGKEIVVKARHIVSATGIFTEQVEALSGHEPQVHVEPSKGVHLVLAKEDIGLGENAIVLPETEDRRILFIVPWESRAIYGTTDTGTGDLDHPTATQEDVRYLLKYLNRYLTVNLTEKDIISVYAGYRPLIKARSEHASTAKLSRTHAVLQSPNGLVSIVGGKLTTYRRMAQDTVDVLNERDGSKPVHPTEHLPLKGSAGWATVQRDLAKRGSELGLSQKTIQHLGDRYGTEALAITALVEGRPALGKLLVPDLPYIKAEVVYCSRYEMVVTLQDMLARRTSIVLEDRQQGLGIAQEVGELMASELNWSHERQTAYTQEYRDYVQTQRQSLHVAEAQQHATGNS